MRYDHTILSREVLRVMRGVLEGKLQAEKALSEKRDRAFDPARRKRGQNKTAAGAAVPLRSRTSPAG
jgi:hypothetical protein